jgi:hypothetical protein
LQIPALLENQGTQGILAMQKILASTHCCWANLNLANLMSTDGKRWLTGSPGLGSPSAQREQAAMRIPEQILVEQASMQYEVPILKEIAPVVELFHLLSPVYQHCFQK